MNRRALLAGVAANAVGNGAMAPFVIPWLAEVAGGSLSTAGLVFAVAGLGQLGMALHAGQLAGRVDRRTLLIAGLTVAAPAAALLPLATGLPAAVTLLFLLGAGQGLASAAQAIALGDLVAAGLAPERIWSHVQIVMNAGLGAGFLLGGLLASPAIGPGMVRLAWINAISFGCWALIAAAVLPRLRPVARAAPVWRWSGFPAGIRRLLVSDAVFLVLGVGFLLLLPLVHVLSVREAAAMLAVNTVLNMVLQLPVRRWQERLKRASALRLLALGTGAAWLLVAVGIHVGAGPLASALVWCAVVLVSLMECLHTASVVPLLSSSATPGDRPRVLSLHVFASKTGLLYGPTIGSLGIAHSGAVTWLIAALISAAPALLPTVKENARHASVQ